MPRKLLRKLLPSHESIREHKVVRRFGPKLAHHNLWHLHRRSVAGGVAVGMLAGLIPGSNPVQFAAGAVGAIAFKVNLPLSVLVTLYSNPFTIVPLYYAAYRIGGWLTGVDNGGLPAVTFSLGERPWTELLPAALDWLMSLGKPLAVGIPTLALALATAAYFLVDWGWRLHVMHAWRKRAKARRREAT
jgi:uncharacterized protein (DUF2062 family)